VGVAQPLTGFISSGGREAGGRGAGALGGGSQRWVDGCGLAFSSLVAARRRDRGERRDADGGAG
jgi:hypothetical protein